jgi:hypothetical protein
MQKTIPALTHRLWFVMLLLASIGISLGFACAVPLAGLAALAVLTLDRRAALVLIVAVVAANQAVGFCVLHYPQDAATIAWGGAFLLVGILAVFAADFVAARGAGLPQVALYALAFVAAFTAYEGSLFLLTVATHSNLYPYAPTNVLRVLAINAATFGVLLAAGRLAVGVRGAARAHLGRQSA